MQEEIFSVVTPDNFAPVIDTVILRAQEIVDQASVISLTGDLGAGKTTFTQQLAAYLGVTETVVSPTFGIMKSYELVDNKHFDQLVHIDAYRIEDISEVGPLRFEEIFKTKRTLICLEWPENIVEILPEQKVAVVITSKEGEERRVVVS